MYIKSFFIIILAGPSQTWRASTTGTGEDSG